MLARVYNVCRWSDLLSLWKTAVSRDGEKELLVEVDEAELLDQMLQDKANAHWVATLAIARVRGVHFGEMTIRALIDLHKTMEDRDPSEIVDTFLLNGRKHLDADHAEAVRSAQ